MKSDTIDVVFSFDTTGSMYQCIGQVRRRVKEVVRNLFDYIPNLRVGIISHGDYYDGKDVMSILDLTDNEREICNFITNAPNTDGGDGDECYEYVLHKARSMHWTSGTNKALVMIGDANPHEVGYIYRGKRNDLDWENERDLLVEAGVNIYPVQALGRYHSINFYNDMVANPENIKLDLPQFGDVSNLLLALCFKRAGCLDEVEDLLRNPSHHVKQTIKALGTKRGRTSKRVKLSVDVPKGLTGRFQVLDVDRDTDIKSFVEENGLSFNAGRGFYEFTKSVTVQDYKDVVAENLSNGAITTGKTARNVLKINHETCKTGKPQSTTHRGFIQSTSNNRKLLAGTRFLYEIDDWS